MKIAVTAGLLAAIAVPAAAGTIGNGNYGTYRLKNHPAGGIQDPLYGLRLDGLDGVSSNQFTFNFEVSGAAMFLDYFDDSGVDKFRIRGQAWGGQDVGSSYATTGAFAGQLWDIDFTYNGVSEVTSDDDLWISDGGAPNGTTSSAAGAGTIKRASETLADAIGLHAYNGHYSYFFQLGDEVDDSGHRMTGGISGWGWVNHSVGGLNNHIAASDWLFTVDPVAVPLPPAAWMGLGLLGVLGIARRRKRRAQTA